MYIIALRFLKKLRQKKKVKSNDIKLSKIDGMVATLICKIFFFFFWRNRDRMFHSYA